MLERKNYSELGDPVGPYVHAVSSNGLLFLSGVTAFGTPAAQGDIAQQARACFAQITRIAELEGCSLASLVKVTLFVTGFEEIQALRGALFETYGAQLPASSLVRVAGLFAPELRIEVEGILALGAPQKARPG